MQFMMQADTHTHKYTDPHSFEKINPKLCEKSRTWFEHLQIIVEINWLLDLMATSIAFEFHLHETSNEGFLFSKGVVLKQSSTFLRKFWRYMHYTSVVCSNYAFLLLCNAISNANAHCTIHAHAMHETNWKYKCKMNKLQLPDRTENCLFKCWWKAINPFSHKCWYLHLFGRIYFFARKWNWSDNCVVALAIRSGWTPTSIQWTITTGPIYSDYSIIGRTNSC